MEAPMKVRSYEFYEQTHIDTRYRTTMEQEKIVKMLAKMVRELTHLKPARGRPGRHLPQDQGLCIELTNVKDLHGNAGISTHIRQGKPNNELMMLETRSKGIGDAQGRYSALQWERGYKDNKCDLARLGELHTLHQSKLRVENVTKTFEDLLNGLMGLGMQDIRVEKGRWDKTYCATMKFQGFTVTIDERPA